MKKIKTALFVLLTVLLSVAVQAEENLNDVILLYEKGDFRPAADALRQKMKAAPQEPEIHFWLGKVLLKTRDWKAAAQEFEKAVNLAPENARYHHWLGRAAGERASRAFLTTAYSLAKQVLKEFQTASKLAPDDIAIRLDLLEFYMESPGMLGGGKDKAEAEARAIAKLDPQKGYYARAMIYKEDKQWEKAKDELTRATVGFPQSAAACTDLADFLFSRKDYEGALTWGKKALAIDHSLKNPQFIVAASETELRKNLEHAGEMLRELAAGRLNDDDPTFEQVYYRLGENHLARGDKTKAKEAFSAALSYNPDYGRAKEALDRIK